jgi:hypothetical protein
MYNCYLLNDLTREIHVNFNLKLISFTQRKGATSQFQRQNAGNNRCLLLKLKLKLKLKLIYERQSVGQSVLVSGAHLGPGTNFSFAMKFPVDSCGFVIL